MAEDLLPRIVIAVTMLGAGALLFWVAEATASGRLGRNQFAGIRTPSTMATEAAWLAAHRAARGSMRWAGGLSVLSGLVAALPVSPAVLAVSTLAAAAGMIFFAGRGARLGVRAIAGIPKLPESAVPESNAAAPGESPDAGPGSAAT